MALLALAALLSATAGCRDRDIRSYSIPKEAGDSTVSQPAGPAEAGVASAPATPKWQAPASWQPQPATGMRLASFKVSDADGATAEVSIVNFGGTGGDELANINRWRGQLKLGPVEADALPAQVTTVPTSSGDYSLADLTAEQAPDGKAPARILGAWLRRGGKVWFFKMMGPAGLVGSQKEAFVAFLGTLNFGGEDSGKPGALAGRAAGTQANTNDLPRSKAAAPDLAALPQGPALPGGGSLKAAEGSLLLWHAPGPWVVKPATSMRKGSYGLGPDGAVDLSVTAFPGDVGGPLANVNRWLGQVGLPPVDEASMGDFTSHMQANGLTFFVVDTGSKDAAHPQRIVAGVVFWQGNSWFFKMTGPSELVAKEKPGFLEFLQTVHAP